MMQNSIVVLRNDAFGIRNVTKLPKEIESGQTRLSKTCPRKQIIREQIVVLFLLDWFSIDCWVNFDYVFDAVLAYVFVFAGSTDRMKPGTRLSLAARRLENIYSPLQDTGVLL